MQYSFSVGDIDKLQIEEEERNKRVGNFPICYAPKARRSIIFSLKLLQFYLM